MISDEDAERWYPVARGVELVPRHVAHTQLLGQELALWRDDAGRANAWENRCPHRGVRLSIGINDGTELRCRYHGWRFASGTAQCTFIPAHPTQKPAGTMKARPFLVLETYGYVWVALRVARTGLPLDGMVRSQASAHALPHTSLDHRLKDRNITTLRSVFVAAPASRVAAEIQSAAPEELSRVHWLQPVDADQSVLHAVVLDAPPHLPRIALLRQQQAALARIRNSAEARYREQR